MELKEYRKRLSLNGTGPGRSPPSAAAFASQSRNAYNNNNNFQFNFPKFGDLPGSNFMSNGSLAKVGSPNSAPSNNGIVQRPGASSSMPNVFRQSSSSSVTSQSPVDRKGSGAQEFASHGSGAYQSPSTYSNNGSDDLSKLFSPSILATASRSNSTDYMSYNGTSTNASKQGSIENATVSRFPPGAHRHSSASTAASPSSSMNLGLDSSTGTTPEPSADSPDNRKTTSDALLEKIDEEIAGSKNAEGKRAFCNEWAKACGNSRNPIPPATSDSNGASVPSNTLRSPSFDTNGIDWLAQQNGGAFDPVLFGDYRDPQDSILNNNNFFNEAWLPQDFNSPYNLTDMSSPPKRDLMKELEVQQESGNEEVVPGDTPKQYLGADGVWLVPGIYV